MWSSQQTPFMGHRNLTLSKHPVKTGSSLLILCHVIYLQCSVSLMWFCLSQLCLFYTAPHLILYCPASLCLFYTAPHLILYCPTSLCLFYTAPHLCLYSILPHIFVFILYCSTSSVCESQFCGIIDQFLFYINLTVL